MIDDQGLRACFVCSLCGAEAGTARLSYGTEGAHFQRDSFTSVLSGKPATQALPSLHEALARADARGLHVVDREYAPFYCPTCDAVYCGQHWQRWDVFDEDGWHDSIRGRCPQGHERMLED